MALRPASHPQFWDECSLEAQMPVLKEKVGKSGRRETGCLDLTPGRSKRQAVDSATPKKWKRMGCWVIVWTLTLNCPCSSPSSAAFQLHGLGASYFTPLGPQLCYL